MHLKSISKFKRLRFYCMNRMRDNFQLTILTLLGILVVLAATPFAIFRLISSHFSIFFIELAIIVFSIILTTYAWLKSNEEIISYIMAITITFVFVSIANFVGQSAYFWFFCSITVNFALLKPKPALIIISVSLLIIFITSDLFLNIVEKMTFIISASTATLFAFIVAQTKEHQRKLLKEIARTDELTGAANRRASTEEINIAISEFKRSQKEYALINLDIDHFKTINDTYGHDIGDKTLIKLVQIINKNTRIEDRLFRVGGEEFIILVKIFAKEEALLLAEKIRQAVENTEILPKKRITISCGVSTLLPTDNAATWRKRADEALYKAKDSGRNCCCMDNHSSAT